MQDVGVEEGHSDDAQEPHRRSRNQSKICKATLPPEEEGDDTIEDEDPEEERNKLEASSERYC